MATKLFFALCVLLLASCSKMIVGSSQDQNKSCPQLPRSVIVDPAISCDLAERAVYYLLVESHKRPIPLQSIEGNLYRLDLDDVVSVFSQSDCAAVVNIVLLPSAESGVNVCVKTNCEG